MTNLDLVIASDHRGFDLKTKIIDYLKNKKILDLGTNSIKHVDYPDYAQKVAEAIIENNHNFPGILICGSGIGMSIASNRYSSIRAALCLSKHMAQQSRLHNDANILVLGSDYTSMDDAFDIIDAFFSTGFISSSRHERRIGKL